MIPLPTEENMPEDMLTLTLPWGPSTNTFLRHFVLPGRRQASTCISEAGREFYRAVGVLLLQQRPPKLSGNLAVQIDLYPPNRRSIDVDNRAKPILDSLKRRPKDKQQYPGAWLFAEDDSQVKIIRTDIRDVFPGGKSIVTVATILPGQVVEPMRISGVVWD